METTAIISFLLAAISLTVMPGPDNIYVMTESMTRGARTGILISVGLISGIIVHTALAATGITLIIQNSPALFNAIKIAGAVYLFYLAYGASREEPIAIKLNGESQSDQSRNAFSLIRRGFFMNVLNQKVSLFFLALLPQFITNNGWAVSTQMMILGLIFMIQGILIFVLIALLAGQLSTVLRRSSFWQVMKWIKVSVLVILGGFILFAST